MAEVPKLTVSEWGDILLEIQQQPAWRARADREADYFDGNQIDAPTLQAMADLGMAPIVENIMSPTVDSVLGLEAQNRLDYVVKAEHSDKHAEVAEAINMKVNEAEKRSGLDNASTEAFAGQTKVGLGWVLVGTDHDPFKYQHKCEFVHRNEVFWDFKCRENHTDNYRYLVRSKWYDVDQLKLAFKDKAELLDSTGAAWASMDASLLLDGGKSTGLAMDYNTERGFTIEEQEWRDSYRKRLRLSEVWYRRWVNGKVLKSPDGRVVEYDESNPNHRAIVQAGILQPIDATYSKVRLSWWVGCHCLADIENPYKHGKIPYVPFFGKREDMTGIPYGLGRPMIPMQDEVNARNTKMIWLLAAKRVTMTKGVADVEQTRSEAARPDAIHVLDPEKMRQGGVFKVETDFELNGQQYQALVDKRNAIKNVAGVYSAFEGNAGSASGKAMDTMVTQTTQTLAVIYDNQRKARTLCGELLMANVIQEMGDSEQVVMIDPGAGSKPKTVLLNQRTAEGMNNDVQRAMLRLSLSSIPSTPSYRQQQSAGFAEILKSLPPEMQAQLMDFYLLSTDFKDKEKAVERIRKMIGVVDGEEAPNPQVEQLTMQLQEMQGLLQQVQQESQAQQQQLIEARMALKDKSGEIELKQQELTLKQQEIAAKAVVPVGDDGMQAAIAAKIEAEGMAIERERIATEARAKEIEREIELAGHASAERIKAMEVELGRLQQQLADEQRRESESKQEKKAESAEEKIEVEDIVAKVTESIAPAFKALMDEIAQIKAASANDAKEDKGEGKEEKNVFYERVNDKAGNLVGIKKVVS